MILIVLQTLLCFLYLIQYLFHYRTTPKVSISSTNLIPESIIDPQSPLTLSAPNHDDDPFAESQSLDYCATEYRNAQSLTASELEHVLKLRTTAPTTVCNPDELAHRRQSWQRLNVSRFSPNLVQFVNRCSVHILSENADFTELWSNNQTTYNHVYKCGGTTIWNALDRLQKDDLMNGRGIKYKLHKNDSFLLRENQYYWDHHRYFIEYFRSNFMFSFVRDPVDRSLKGIE